MNIINVLLDSLKLLKNRPQLFVPKLLSATVSSTWALIALDLFRSGNVRGLIQFYTFSMHVIILLGVFVPLMTAEMIRNRDRKGLLKVSFIETAGNWKKILGLFFITLCAVFIGAAPATAGMMAYIVTGKIMFATLGIGLSLFLILSAGFLSYFLPISILDEDTFISGVRQSVKTSLQNRNEVSLLMLFSFGMFGIAALSQGMLRNLGEIFFFLGRLLSATVTTYTYVISPNYYLKEKQEKEDKK